MSYILEALKKSDAERKRGEVPTLSNTQIDPTSFTPSGGPSVALIVSGVIGVLIVGGVGAWLMLSGDVKPEPTQQLAQPASEEPTPQLPAPVQQEQVAVAQPSPAPEQPLVEQTAPPTPTVELSKTEPTAPEPAPQPQPAPEVIAQPTPPAVAEKAKVEPKSEPVVEPMPEPQEVTTLNAKAAPAPTVEGKSAPLREATLPTAGMKAETKPGAKKTSALKNAKALVDRAWTNMDQGLYAQALSNLDEALVADPAYAEAWFARGWALEKSGDEAAAIVDYGRAIDAKPGHAMALFSRGFLNLYGGNPHDAVVDFVRTQGVAKDESLRLYSHLWLYLSRVRADQNAQERLKSDTAQASLTQWPGPLIMHFLGNMNESAVLTFIEQGTKAGLKERRATGYFFLGISAQISGDKERARTYFEKTLATGAVDFRQYDAAGRELKKLR
ncbi:MAG: tetratricopeptide repeat protein [Rhodospirillales bacterium]|nr:tetratricopeptide repeat protein [Rhodospirillales bacterium]